VVGGWLQIHQPQVVPPYFAARKKNPVVEPYLYGCYSNLGGTDLRKPEIELVKVVMEMNVFS
jgi:hypothetical protein